jgi:pyruvate dehydrogenase E2 component (dihydrolipoamide acetyltransferase)
MPQMGYDMQEGTLVRWLVEEGVEVAEGQAIAEIETDKAVVEFESTSSGMLRKIWVSEGDVVPVGHALGIVADVDEDISQLGPSKPSAESITDSPQAISDDPDGSTVPDPVVADISQVEEKSDKASRGQVRASPAARSIAAERGIDLNQLDGTGPGGRITKADVLVFKPADGVPAAIDDETTQKQPAVEDIKSILPDESANILPASRMRDQITRVTVKSKQEIPHYYVSAEIDMSKAMDLREQVNHSLEGQGIRVSVNDIIVKACTEAIKVHPKFNAVYSSRGIEINQSINIGIAIAGADGLIVPAILGCENRSVAEIAKASRDLIERSKGGTLSSEEYTSGTFTISNLGMYDVTSFIAIIHPPQAAVLAVGSVQEQPVVREGEIVASRVMSATLSADHRVSDGAEGARFLVEIKRLLEEPVLLLM